LCAIFYRTTWKIDFNQHYSRLLQAAINCDSSSSSDSEALDVNSENEQQEEGILVSTVRFEDLAKFGLNHNNQDAMKIPGIIHTSYINNRQTPVLLFGASKEALDEQKRCLNRLLATISR
jgi:hypothetical protein